MSGVPASAIEIATEHVSWVDVAAIVAIARLPVAPFSRVVVPLANVIVDGIFGPRAWTPAENEPLGILSCIHSQQMPLPRFHFDANSLGPRGIFGRENWMVRTSTSSVDH